MTVWPFSNTVGMGSPTAGDIPCYRFPTRCTVLSMKSLLWSRPEIHTESSWLTQNHNAIVVPVGTSFYQVGVVSTQGPVLGKAVVVSSLLSSFWHCVRQPARREFPGQFEVDISVFHIQIEWCLQQPSSHRGQTRTAAKACGIWGASGPPFLVGRYPES